MLITFACIQSYAQCRRLFSKDMKMNKDEEKKVFRYE